MSEDAHLAYNDLGRRFRARGRAIQALQETLKERNLEIDRLHQVWCTGGCPSGMHRYDTNVPDITEEEVLWAERYADRLRQYYTNKQHRDRMGYDRR